YRELPFPFSLRNQDFAKHLSDDREFREINAIIMNSSRILGGHMINKVREDLSEPVGNLFWLWGMGKTKEVVPFSERIMKKTCYISLNNGLNGMPDYFGFERIGDISLYEENSLLWLNNSLDFNEKQSIMVKRFESFDRDYLGRIREISAAGEYRIIFIFDSFTGKNAVLNNEWGVYCAITNPSPPPFRMRKYVKKSRMFMEEFSR
ncbi:MAG TPA: hypothetical protein PKN36_07310, partial [bacterium]|nr:hypothetical protein [bacterium]